jgi:hypothetical protein
MLQAWFKPVTQVTTEINDTRIRDQLKRDNPLKAIAQVSEFYVPGISLKDRISKTFEELDTFKDWSDLDLLINKNGWEHLGISTGTLLSGVYEDAYGYTHPIQQTMADVENDTCPDEFQGIQAWYLVFNDFHHLHCLSHKQSLMRY